MNIVEETDAVKEYDILKHCHVNTNGEGDRFVGVRLDTDTITVHFPIGYELSNTEAEVRNDIMNLIQVLSEFTTKTERLISTNKSNSVESVEFPIHAYRYVIEYFFSIGGKYYTETDVVYKTSSKGNQDWSKTFKKQSPLVYQKNGVNNLIYTNFTVRTSTPNDQKLITQINRNCVYEAFQRLGWLYGPYVPEHPGITLDSKTSIVILRNKLANTNDDKKKQLFQSMLDMLTFMDNKTSDKELYYGTGEFEWVWEKLIDRAFGVRHKEEYFPRAKWKLKFCNDTETRPLMPDTIMIHDGKYYVLDAKYYKYGITGRSDHLPNGSSINKQITYGEYLDKYKQVNFSLIYNAFIMPYSKNSNLFGLHDNVAHIGEATGDWKGEGRTDEQRTYERIQGIVIDTKYLMNNYLGNTETMKIALVLCIESEF